jgi:hypothetical protein
MLAETPTGDAASHDGTLEPPAVDDATTPEPVAASAARRGPRTTSGARGRGR